ncbi:hypothetical protein GP486_003540 [Trichoglossum hirsutum]|uniref:F-box domain-containing protein n=1 Tax=Trichoglossum hirsutum TaxID=265104 RepID=A0A9P8LCF1_9PEZI|nr:hypothetical protein GP486_003540 [Trichoglossum hirsutum]
MPNLLSLPRELRDDIYKWVLHGPFPSASRSSTRSRKRISKQPPKKPLESDEPPKLGPGDEYYDGEEVVRYPLATPLPPTYSLLHTNRQIRDEMLDSISRTPLRYKVELAFRQETETLYPTWISVPALSHRVDVLDVDLRVRRGKTSSVCSFSGDDEREHEGDIFSGGLTLLRRFLERGVFFLSSKKAQKISVGLLALNVLTKDLFDNCEDEAEEAREAMDNVGQALDQWFVDDIGDAVYEYRTHIDDIMQLLKERVGRFSCRIGDSSREWDIKAVMAERERLKLKREREREQEPEPTAEAN